MKQILGSSLVCLTMILKVMTWSCLGRVQVMLFLKMSFLTIFCRGCNVRVCFQFLFQLSFTFFMSKWRVVFSGWLLLLLLKLGDLAASLPSLGGFSFPILKILAETYVTVTVLFLFFNFV